MSKKVGNRGDVSTPTLLFVNVFLLLFKFFGKFLVAHSFLSFIAKFHTYVIFAEQVLL